MVSVGENGDRVLDVLARATAMALSAPLGVIGLVGPHGQVFAGAHGLPDGVARVRDRDEVSPLCREVWLTGRPVIVHDARRRQAAGSAVLAELGVVAYAGLPVVVNGTAIGAIAVIDHRIHAWSERDIELLRQLAELAALTLERYPGGRVALARERSLTALLVRAATASRVVDVLEDVAHHTGWTSADLLAVRDGRLHLHAAYPGDDRHAPFFAARDWPMAADPLASRAHALGAPSWLTDLGHQPAYTGARGDVAPALATGFAIPVPGYAAVFELFTAVAEPRPSDLAHVARAVVALIGAVLARTPGDAGVLPAPAS